MSQNCVDKNKQISLHNESWGVIMYSSGDTQRGEGDRVVWPSGKMDKRKTITS